MIYTNTMTEKLKILFSKPERAFLVIASFFGLLSAILMPILLVPDENQHFQISYAIFSSNQRDSQEKSLPEDLVLSENLVLSAVRDGSYAKYSNKTSAQHDGIAINREVYVFDGRTKASVFDVMHLPQALGILVARHIYPSLELMVIMGRLFNLALYIAAFYFIIKKVKFGKWVFLFIACPPMMIQQAASLSYDPINLVAIAAWIAFIINLSAQAVAISSKQLLTGLGLGLFLLLTKSNNILLMALLFAIPKDLIQHNKPYTRLRSSKHWNTIKYVALSVFIGIIFAGLYITAHKLLGGQEFHLRKLGSALLNTFFWGDLGLIDVTLIGMVGQFSNFYYHLPVWIVIITFAVLAIIMLHEKLPRISKKFAVISGLLFLGSILFISVGMYYGWALPLDPRAEVTNGIQGRYFTPLLLLLVPVFAYVQNYIKVSVKSSLTIPALAIVTSASLLLIYIIQTWHFFWQ